MNQDARRAVGLARSAGATISASIEPFRLVPGDDAHAWQSVASAGSEIDLGRALAHPTSRWAADRSGPDRRYEMNHPDTERPPTTSLQPGATFAGFVIEKHIGAGGMGDVYEVRHQQLQKKFALKILRAEFTAVHAFAARFEREMKTVSRLDHPNIVMATDGGSVNGQVWFTMTYVEGTDAQRALMETPTGMPPERAVSIIEKVAAAVDYAHRQGILHRDIKPANILLAPEPEPDDERVYLTDFGIAKAIDEAKPLTATGQIPLTIDYASPEQIEGRTLDTRSDIYALGGTLFTLLTGSVPYPADSLLARANLHLSAEPPSPSSLVPELPAAFDDVIHRAMAKDPGDRYQTSRELAVAARRSLTRPEPADHLATAPTTLEIPDRYPPQVIPPPTVPALDQSQPSGKSRLVPAGAAALAIAGITAVVLWSANSNGGSTVTAGASAPISTLSNQVPETSGPDAATAVGLNAATASISESTQNAVAARPLADLLNPAPQPRPAVIGGQTVANAPAYPMDPRDCPTSTQRVSADLAGGYQRITGNLALGDDTPVSTRTNVAFTVDDQIVLQRVLSPTQGASFDLNVHDKVNLVITLDSLGHGSCDSGNYFVFITESLAYTQQP